MSAYKELAKIKLLEKMTEEERMMYLMMTEQERSASKIREDIQTLQNITIKNKHSFLQDLSANVAGNAIFDGFVFLVSSLFKRIKP